MTRKKINRDETDRAPPDVRLERSHLGLKIPQWLVDEYGEIADGLKEVTKQPISNVQVAKAMIVAFKSLSLEQQIAALKAGDDYVWQRTAEILAEGLKTMRSSNSQPPEDCQLDNSEQPVQSGLQQPAPAPRRKDTAG